MMHNALDVKQLEVRYGPIRAVEGVNLKVASGGITALLGANGAGKTTTVMAIAGVRKIIAGSISVFGKDTTSIGADNIVRAGVSISPEGRRIFASLSVEENMIAAGAILKESRVAKERREKLMERFPILLERRHQLAGLLSGGEQQMLAVARALMSEPKLLLLDEPSLGLAPKMVDQIFDIIETLKAEGISVLLVEQNAALALEVADHAVVLANGKVAAAGAPNQIADDNLLREAYLAG